MADRSARFCSYNFSFFLVVLFLVTSHTSVRLTVKGKELQAWGHHHQASGQNVKNMQSLPLTARNNTTILDRLLE